VIGVGAREAASVVESQVAIEVILLGQKYAFFRKDFLKGCEVQRFGIGDYTVAVKDDGFQHC
jgi:hypothetical protein